MDKRRDSLRFRFLAELSNILKFPSSRGHPVSHPRIANSATGKQKNPSPASTSKTSLATSSNSVSNTSNKPSSASLQAPKTASSLSLHSSADKNQECSTSSQLTQPVQAVASSSRNKQTEKPSSITSNSSQEKFTTQLPFSKSLSTTVIQAPPRPQTPGPRRTERVKSIKRQGHGRSASLFYLDQHDQPMSAAGGSSPSQTEKRSTELQLRQNKVMAPKLKAASVDDLLDITNSHQTSHFTPVLQPTPATASSLPNEHGASLLSVRNKMSQGLGDIDPYAPRRASNTEKLEASNSATIKVPKRNFSSEVQKCANQLASYVRSSSSALMHGAHQHNASMHNLPFTTIHRSTASLNQAPLNETNSTANQRRLSIQAGATHWDADSGNPRITRLTPIASPSKNSSRNPNNATVANDPSGRLKFEDKIVWFTEKDIAQTGTIKWLGKLNEKYMAGIEFENSIGNTSGKWNGRQLFTVALTKGRFVPMAEILLYADYKPCLPCNEPAHIQYPSCESSAADKEQITIICVICQDDLLDFSKDEDPCNSNTSQAVEIVTTKCGHLFHNICLKKWFDTKKKSKQPCPYCQREMTTTDIIRIFPVQGK